MIGFSAWLPKLFFVLVAAVFLIGLYAEWKPVFRRQTPVTGKRVFGTVFILVWAALLLQLFVREAHFHQQLNHLSSEDVDHIEVGAASINNRPDINAVVVALNQCQGFSVNHGGWADEVPLLIHLKNGRLLSYHVAYYLRAHGAILSSQSSYEGSGMRWSNGYLFSATLPDVLKSSGVSLPTCHSTSGNPCAK